MGGDNAPHAVIEGIAAASRKDRRTFYELVGPQEKMDAAMRETGVRFGSNVSVVDGGNVIGMHENMSQLSDAELRRTTIGIAVQRTIDAQRGGWHAVCLGGGNSGAITKAGNNIMGKQRHIKRTAFASRIPVANGADALLLDTGARPIANYRPKEYVQMYYMALALYAEMLKGCSPNQPNEPTVGWLSISGEKVIPGQEQAYEAVAREHGSDPVLVEKIANSKAHIILTDAILGNIAMKSTKGGSEVTTERFIKRPFLTAWRDILRRPMRAIPRTLLAPAAAFVGSVSKTEKEETVRSWAPLLGIDHALIKVPGESEAEHFQAAALQAVQYDVEAVNKRIHAFLQPSTEQPERAA